MSNTEYNTAYIYECGCRKNNEDSIAIISIAANNRHYLLAVVADGIGGLEAGEVASSYLTGQLRSDFIRITQSENCISLGRLRKEMSKVIFRCHRMLLDISFSRGIRMGTTLAMLVLAGNSGFVINVGDSRIYELNFKEQGILRSQDDVDERGRLTAAIGCGEYVRPHFRRIRLKKGRFFVICSDGFYRKTGDILGECDCISSGNNLSGFIKKVRDRAVELGERDNISSVIVGIR